MRRPCVTFFALLTATLACVANADADEVVRWNFGDGTAGWKAIHQCEIESTDGVLTIRSGGRDPQLVNQVAGPAGWKKLTVHARRGGRLRGQIFWTTEDQTGTSEAASVRFNWDARNREFKTFEVFFKPDAPLTSIRIDPTDRKGRLQVAWMALTNQEPPKAESTPAEAIKTLDGFKVERLHSVQKDQGSWVSLTHDDKGRLITSDQYGKLYRVTPGANETDTKIEPLNVEVGMAQGLLYAFDSLYVMVNGNKPEKQGLWRLTDADGDDTFERVEHLRHLKGGGEHGPHAIVLSPDGKSLYVCAGNHTDPTEFQGSVVPLNFQEDQLLPRMWDAGGHAVGKMAPGGWVAKVTPDGKNWTLFASGFRNEYDIAFNQHGELFTYDADMEWDVGSPWYRPTRVNHVVSGAEFGWRSGTGKWPEWYPDSLGSVIDIGPGSPTGIVFGTDAKFPPKYQQALFISDWSYGVVYAVHMEPKGSTYTATKERFLAAAPLPVTDLVVNPKDGAFYFTIGGRRTQSGLYRVTYTGSEATAPAKLADTGSDMRKLRQSLESLHKEGADGAVEKAWEHLGHEDRNIRFAARIALEHQPLDEWRKKALEETDPAKSLNALLALCRNGTEDDQISVIQSLSRVSRPNQAEEDSLAALRVLELSFIRLGEPSDAVRDAVANALRDAFPAQSQRMNRELSQILIYLQDDSVAEKTLKLMANAPSQEEQIQYALWLRSLKTGWNEDLRHQYFQWFNEAMAMRGGNSFSRFLTNIRDEAKAGLTNKEKEQLKDVLTVKAQPIDPTAELNAREKVKSWTVNELLPMVAANSTGRDFENGRRMFSLTACYKCHRFAGTGGIVGPDLTGAGRRFNNRNLLEALIEPGKVISDQYEATTFLMESGKQVTGRVANLNGDTIKVIEDMLNPGRMTNLKVSEIEEKEVSKVSMMPTGLLDRLTSDEILDLVAYLKSGGDSGHSIYKARVEE